MSNEITGGSNEVNENDKSKRYIIGKAIEIITMVFSILLCLYGFCVTCSFQDNQIKGLYTNYRIVIYYLILIAIIGFLIGRNGTCKILFKRNILFAVCFTLFLYVVYSFYLLLSGFSGV